MIRITSVKDDPRYDEEFAIEDDDFAKQQPPVKL